MESRPTTARKKQNRKPCEIAGPWPTEYTPRDVQAYANSKLNDFTYHFTRAAEEKNIATMRNYVILMRAVVTRLDAYRRHKAREWYPVRVDELTEEKPTV